jgi:DNA-binding GntR family transcriptional regulator
MAFERPPTSQEAVLGELRRAILEGEIKPGAQIVQDALAERLGVSRVPVREALKILEGEGQVRYLPHHGYFVTELDLAELQEIYRMRALLEAETVRAAVPRLAEEDLSRLDQAVEDMAVASDQADIVAMTAANRRFHFSLFEPSDMPRFIRIIRQLWDSSDPYRSLYFAERTHRDDVDREHRAILVAAHRGATEDVVRLLAEHRDHAVLGLGRVLGSSEQITP